MMCSTISFEPQTSAPFRIPSSLQIGNVIVQTVPEPATAWMFIVASSALALLTRRKRISPCAEKEARGITQGWPNRSLGLETSSMTRSGSLRRLMGWRGRRCLRSKTSRRDLKRCPMTRRQSAECERPLALRVLSPESRISQMRSHLAAVQVASGFGIDLHRGDPSISLQTEYRASVESARLTHLQRLEAESIHIMREVVAECESPVMLYSIGKDARSCCTWPEGFLPRPPPFPLLHVDTTWKFREMIAFRDETAKRHGLDLNGAHQRGRAGGA